MKHLFAPISLAAALLGIMLSVSGCQQATQVQTSVCAEMAKLPPNVVAVLDAQDPHSTLGVYWADAKSACANGVIAQGVSETWGSMMWGAVKALAPTLLPYLIGLL